MCLGGWKAGSTLGRFAAPRPIFWVVVCALKHSQAWFLPLYNIVKATFTKRRINPERNLYEGMLLTKTNKSQHTILLALVNLYT